MSLLTHFLRGKKPELLVLNHKLVTLSSGVLIQGFQWPTPMLIFRYPLIADT